MTLADCDHESSRLRIALAGELAGAIHRAVNADPIDRDLVRCLRAAMAIAGTKEEWLPVFVLDVLAFLDGEASA